jgi:hypothetical protein
MLVQFILTPSSTLKIIYKILLLRLASLFLKKNNLQNTQNPLIPWQNKLTHSPLIKIHIILYINLPLQVRCKISYLHQTTVNNSKLRNSKCFYKPLMVNNDQFTSKYRFENLVIVRFLITKKILVLKVVAWILPLYMK